MIVGHLPRAGRFRICKVSTASSFDATANDMRGQALASLAENEYDGPGTKLTGRILTGARPAKPRRRASSPSRISLGLLLCRSAFFFEFVLDFWSHRE